MVAIMTGDYADADQWRPPGRTPKRASHPVILGKRHIITSPNQPHDIPCYCPISQDHTEDDYYTHLPPTRTT